MNKQKEIGPWTLTVGAGAIALLMYFVITIDHWSDLQSVRVEPACSTACTPVVPGDGDQGNGIKNSVETVTTPPQTLQEARDKYLERNAYRARNLIGWT